MGKAMINIGVIADLVVTEIGDPAKKYQILQYIALGFQQMHLFLNHDVCIKSEVIEMDDDLSYEMPCDFIYETKVGVRRAAKDGHPPGKLCVLTLNTGLQTSNIKRSDTETINDILFVINDYNESIGSCYFYNSQYGIIDGYGTGFMGNNYYNIKDGVINISPFLLSNLGEDIELIVEYKSDGLSGGLTLVPAEAFLCLQEFAHARLNMEGPYGPHQLNHESHYGKLKRLYNNRPINVLVELFAVR